VDPPVDGQVATGQQQEHSANIGLRTGMSFDVIDLDGEAAVDAMERAPAGRERLRGPVVKTGKGYHYAVLPTSLRNVFAAGTIICGRRGLFEPGSSDRGSRHLLELSHQRPVRVGPVADSCDAGIRPIGPWRRAGEGDQVQR
jgi:hypothetical protein